MKSLILIILSLLSSVVFADYHVATYNTASLKENAPTRVIVIGSAEGLGLLFHEVAKGKARKYAENFPDDQILVLATYEKHLNTEWSLKRYGFKVLRTDKSTLDGEEFVKALSGVKKIRSLDIFSHSSDQFGLHLNGRANRLHTTTKKIDTLKGNFMKEAYAVFHGCNSGFSIAPFFSNTWGIPVAGSLTSTDFQRLHSDGEYYLTREGYNPNTDWAKTNETSYNEEVKCSDGGCVRMKPDNTPYVGFWGAYREGGLPFYKFFCVKNSTEICQKALAQSLLSHTLRENLKKDSSFEIYKKAVVDYLCPVSARKDLKSECQNELETAQLTKDFSYNPFSRPQVECDFKGCKGSITCDKSIVKGVPKPGSCRFSNEALAPATTLVREYQAYLESFKYLSQF